MAKDAHDDQTSDFIDPSAAGVMKDILDGAKEDLHLAAEHALVVVEQKMYVRDAAKAQKKTSNAARQEAFIAKKRAAGLTKAFVPESVAEGIKTAGGFEKWLDAQKIEKTVTVEKIVEVPVDRIVEKVVEVPVDRIVEKVVQVEKLVPAKLSLAEQKTLAIGSKVEKLTGWRRTLINALL